MTDKQQQWAVARHRMMTDKKKEQWAVARRRTILPVKIIKIKKNYNNENKSYL
jgi:hypothetical protein